MRIIGEKKVKTRKDHVCWGCARKIPKGSLMTVVVSAEGSKIDRVYWCMVCEEYSMKHWPDDEEPVTLGAFRIYGEDEWEEIRKSIEEFTAEEFTA